jgi:hypothetical protein
MEEIDDSVKTAVWVGDCFVYTSNGQWQPSHCGTSNVLSIFLLTLTPQFHFRQAIALTTTWAAKL